MKVTGWAIDGFGRFCGDQVRDLPDGLVVVHGPNEAGKTTLMDFLKGMLFGFPDRRHNRRRHEPLAGGALGGRLFVVASDGTPLTIERGQARSSLRVLGPDGEEPPGALADLLGHVSLELYENVFAVDLDALATLGALDQDEIRDRIFSAGVIGGGTSARDALDALEARRNELWKPNGRGDGYRLKQLRRELADATTALREAQRTAAGVADARARIDQLRREADAARDAADGARNRRQVIEAASELWETWSAADAARRAFATAPPVPDLDPELGTRLTGAERRLDDAEQAVRDAAERLDVAERELAEAPRDPDVLACADEIDALCRQREAEAERRERITAIARELDERRADLHDQLTRLGPRCDERWLAEQPVTIDVEAELRVVADAVVKAEDRLARAEAEARRRAAEREGHATDRAEAVRTARQAAEGPQGDVAAARRRVSAIDELRHQLARLDEAERAEALRAGATGAAGAHRLPGWIPVALPALAALAGVAAALGAATGSPPTGAIMLVVAAALGVAAVAARRPDRSAGNARTTGTGVAAGAVPGTAAALAVEVRTLAAAVGAPPRPTGAQLATLDAEAHEALDRATSARSALEQALSEQRRFAVRAERERVADEAEVTAAREALELATRTWHTWLDERRLPRTVDPTGAGDFLAGLRRAREAQRDIERHAADLERSRAASRAFTQRVRALAAALDDDPERHADELHLLDVLAERLDAARAADRALAGHTAAVETAREVLAAARCQRDEARADLDALVAFTGAADIAGARAVVAQVELHRSWTEQIERAERDLTTRCGPTGPHRDGVLALLAEGDPLSWPARAEAADHDRRTAQEAYERALDELARTQHELDAVLASHDVPALQLRVEALRAELAAAAVEWTALATAHRMIEVTLERYKRERQPRVIKRAARLFADVTEGSYERLVLDDRAVVAVDAAGRHVDAGALSRGTVEQLYLCLRFALAEELAATAPLPLMLDDVLVNADPHRARQMAATVVDVAERHQVFLFTCHPWVVDLFLDAGTPHLLALPPPNGGSAMTPSDATPDLQLTGRNN